MNNFAIARVFTRIADLMEIQGENPFKIKAYRTAAQTMQDLTESLETIAERGELRSVPGIGEAIAAKTQEILETGTCKLYEKLKELVPESLIELLGLPAFGSKKIQTVWKELGIANLDALEQAARDGRLRGVPGFGAKTEENLLKGIEAHRRRLQRMPIAVAKTYAEGLARMLGDGEPFERVEVAGSVRRMQDTVERIDLVGVTADPAKALEAVARQPEVKEVVERTSETIMVCTHNGALARIWASTPAAMGSVLLRATGSDDHVARLRERDGALEGEAPVYQRLGLPFIVPVLREGRGEIEAAAEGRLPNLITVEDIRGVLHAHSTWSDGSASIERMAAAARELGFRFHGNTDHSQALGIAHGLNEERLRTQMAEIEALNATFTDGFRILKGIECDILWDGSLDLPHDLLAELDFVIGSVHAHQKQDRETMTQRIVRALDTGLVDLLAHPTGRILGARDPYAVDMDRVMDAALANGTAMEINAFPDRLDLNEVYARQAMERGIPISINPDAHRPQHLSLLQYGIAQARRAWLEPEQVINCWELDRLLEWLDGRGR
jgi:DNA polymerase (family 10)